MANVWALILALALLPPLHGPALREGGPALPDGCRAENANVTLCQWTVDSTGDASASWLWPLPDASRAAGQVTVAFRGQDAGWVVNLMHDQDVVSQATHAAPDLVAADARVVDTTVHLLLNESAPAGWKLGLIPTFLARGDIGITNVVGSGASRSLGTFNVTFVGEALPVGAPPARPAASAQVPQLSDPAYDAPSGGTDVVAAWLNDAREGDGLLDAHLKMRDMRDFATGSGGHDNFVLHFHVRDTDFFVSWGVSRTSAGYGMGCSLVRVHDGTNERIAVPVCEWDRENGTLSATFLERSLGNPAPGEAFTAMSADVYVFGSVAQTMSTGAPSDDRAEGERFPFALGGPTVWDGLNGGAFVPAPVSRHWYEDPLASDNLPNTLQVVGAVVAVVSFLVGLVMLRRNRAHTKRLLDRVEELVAKHEENAREALHALGHLEVEITDLYRGGKINEAQYQVATQRIVAAASRIALRRELGLDDGTPDVDARRVPVEEGSGPARRA